VLFYLCDNCLFSSFITSSVLFLCWGGWISPPPSLADHILLYLNIWKGSFIGPSISILTSTMNPTMHRSAKFQAPPTAVDFLWSCEWVFLLCFLGQIVINDHDWQLRICPFCHWAVIWHKVAVCFFHGKNQLEINIEWSI